MLPAQLSLNRPRRVPVGTAGAQRFELPIAWQPEQSVVSVACCCMLHAAGCMPRDASCMLHDALPMLRSVRKYEDDSRLVAWIGEDRLNQLDHRCHA